MYKEVVQQRTDEEYVGFIENKYTQWKTLNMRATGLGRNPTSGCIEANDAWWKEQNDVSIFCKHMNIICFNQLILLMCSLFSGNARLHNLSRCTT
jgi:hypothetical protein